jgi:hypothetical protein
MELIGTQLPPIHLYPIEHLANMHLSTHLPSIQASFIDGQSSSAEHEPSSAKQSPLMQTWPSKQPMTSQVQGPLITPITEGFWQA